MDEVRFLLICTVIFVGIGTHRVMSKRMPVVVVDRQWDRCIWYEGATFCEVGKFHYRSRRWRRTVRRGRR